MQPSNTIIRRVPAPDIYQACFRCALLFFLLFLHGLVFAQVRLQPIGFWRDHLSYQNTTQVITGDKIYCAANTHVFSVDAANEVDRYTKVTGLNDVGVRCIGWDNASRQLIIAYHNSNIDVVHGSGVKNIGDVKRSGISGNKSINAVFCREGFAYLSSGLGIIIADLSRYEIKDTWFIGNNGGQVNVNAFCTDNTFFYAATAEGVKRAPINSAALANYNSWQNLSGNNGLPTGVAKNVVLAYSQVFVQTGDSLFVFNGNTWQLAYTDPAWSIVNITSSENKLLVCQRNASGNARVIVLTGNGSIERILSQSGVISLPLSAILSNNIPWVADQFGGLSRFSATVDRFVPNGPPAPADGEMAFSNDTLFVAAGSVNTSWNYQYNRNGVYRFRNGLWDARSNFNTPVLDSVLDFITIAVNPGDRSLWGGSYGGGLVNFRNDNTIVLYKKNLTLQPATGDPSSYRISGLAFDRSNNLWISNYGAPQNLQVRKNDGSWKSFTIPFLLTENAAGQIIADDYDQLWIVSPKNNGLVCYRPGAGIDNTNDDKWKLYRQGAGNGNLPSNNILCIAKDKNGFIWVGTDRGVGIIQCTGDVFGAQPCEATVPVVQQNGFNGLLFKDELVQSIAVDGANRKWVGTKNGVWLVSADGEKMLYRFTAENSALLHNDVRKIAVNPVTGEVFFATFSGICSFRSTATEADNRFDQVLVFPNPVPPGYSGTIAIKGLADNSFVKITELNGRLVYQGRALGGQFTWNGKDYKGGKAASGVYLVLARNDSGNEQFVTRIVIVSGR